MSGDFTGWPEAAYDVLLRLDGDPPASVLETLRADHERLIRKPMQSLCDVLNDLGAYGVYYLDGSSTASGWQHQRATYWMARRVRMSVQFDLDGLSVSGGWTSPSNDGQLSRYRKAVDDESSGGELADIVAELDRSGYELTGSSLARPPRGYSAGHRHAALLRRQSVFAGKRLGAGEWLHTSEAIERVRAGLDPLLPLTSWLVDYVAVAGHAPVW